MKNQRLLSSWLVLAFVFLWQIPLFAFDVPKKPDNYVTDKANVLSMQARSGLIRALQVYEQQTSNQIFVGIFPSLEGGTLEDVSIRIAEQWQPGQKGKDNGVLFLVFMQDRRMRIEVGYGLEGALTDGTASIIILNIVQPHFIKNNYEIGILRGVQAIMQALDGELEEARPVPQYASPFDPRTMTPEQLEAWEAQKKFMGIALLAILAFFFLIDGTRYMGYVREHRLYQKRYSFWEWWFRFALLLFVLSILFRVLFYAMLFSRGGYYGGRSGFHGFSGGGGGSFGGGGASGGW